MDIAVVPFTPADGAAVRQAHDIVRAAARADLPDFPNPTREAFEGSLRHAWPGRGFEWALVTAVQSPAGDVPGPIFAARTGADAALDEARSRLDVAGVDQGELDRLLKDAWGRADGYRLVQWTGRAPDDVVAAVAYLEGRLNTDAPTGDVAWEAEAVDAEQIRAIEAAREARLRRTHHSGVVHVAGGRLVGWTHLVLTGGQVRHAWQDTTIVDPEHRGRRLGLLVKIENLRYALRHEPGLQVIDTFNAAENAHMISINEAMGFRRVDMWMQWQLTL
jgi:RimJ/RimL family protein N-acetyltransferase